MRFLPVTLAILAPLGLALTAPDPAPKASTEAEAFVVDPVHSSVHFKVKHNDAAYFYGRFSELSGEFTFDAEDPSKSEVRIEVQAGSVDTRNDKLNSHIMSPDFFDAKQFPIVSFTSSKIEQIDEALYKVTGEFAMHGVTKEITIEMEHVGTSEGRSGKIIGFHTIFTVNRRDYGMNYGRPEMLGDDVEIILSIEAGAR